MLNNSAILFLGLLEIIRNIPEYNAVQYNTTTNYDLDTKTSILIKPGCVDKNWTSQAS